MGTIISCHYTVISLKLWSYIQVNYWCRSSLRTKRFRAGMVGPGLHPMTTQKSMADLTVQPKRKKDYKVWHIGFLGEIGTNEK